MKKGFLILLSMVVFASIANAANFIVCKSTYALCTTAPCSAIAGKKDLVSCHCTVQTGYSAGQKPCQAEKASSQGQMVKSRYFPIKSYMVCANDRPWAWCLDKPCVVDKNDPTKADCTCNVVQNKGKYIIVTNGYDQSACTTGLYSSATLTGSEQLTNFLKNQPNLKPFPITVYDK